MEMPAAYSHDIAGLQQSSMYGLKQESAQMQSWEVTLVSSDDEDDSLPPSKRRRPTQPSLSHSMTALEKPKETLPALMVHIMNELDCPELMTSHEIFERIRARHPYYAEVFNQKTLKSNVTVYLSQDARFMKRGMVGPAAPNSCWWSLTQPYSLKPLSCAAPPQRPKLPTVPRCVKQIIDVSGSQNLSRTNNPDTIMRVDELYHVKRNYREDYEVEARYGAQAWSELPSLEVVNHMDETFKHGDIITIAVDAGGGKDGEDFGQIFQIRQINDLSNAVAIFWFKNKSSSFRMCNNKHRGKWLEDGLQYMITNEVGVISMHTITAKATSTDILQLSAHKTVLDVSSTEYKIRDFSEKEVVWMQKCLPRGQVLRCVSTAEPLHAQHQTTKRLASIAADTELSRSFASAIDSAYESSPLLRRRSPRTHSSQASGPSQGIDTMALVTHTSGTVPAAENVFRIPTSTSSSTSLSQARLKGWQGLVEFDRQIEVDSVLPEARPTFALAPVRKDSKAIIDWLRKKVDGFSAKDEVELQDLEMFEGLLTQMVANTNDSRTSTTDQHYQQDPEVIVDATDPLGDDDDDDSQFGAVAATSDDKVHRLETEMSEVKASLSALQAWTKDFERKMFPKSNTAATSVWPKFGETPNESFRKQYNLPLGVVVYKDPDGTPMYRDNTRNEDGSLKVMSKLGWKKILRKTGSCI